MVTRKPKERKTLTFSKYSWHGKVYSYWRRSGHFKTYTYKENLCHYWRCVIIWGPLQFLFNGIIYPIHDIEWLTPGTIFIVLLFGAGNMALGYLYIGYLIVIYSFITIGAFIGVISVIIIFTAASVNYRRESKIAKKNKGSNFIKVTAHFIVAKKHGICPFIELDE